ncbi:MAG: hypothetical protein H0U55_05010 [Rubrobacteraceae bacterium]|nr:hypothetical protein [Rubrobacteraceae bacterium]
MRATLTFKVDLPDEGLLAEAEAECVATLNELGTVSFQSQQVDDHEFTIIGTIIGRPAETWREVVRAQDYAEAKAMAMETDEKRNVVAVFSGTPQEIREPEAEPPQEIAPQETPLP